MNSTKGIKTHFSLAKNMATQLPSENDRNKIFKFIKMIEDATAEELLGMRFHAIRLLLASLITNQLCPPFDVEPRDDQNFVTYNWNSYHQQPENNTWEISLDALLKKEAKKEEANGRMPPPPGTQTNYVFLEDSKAHWPNASASSFIQNDSYNTGNEASNVDEIFCYNCTTQETAYNGPRLVEGNVTREFMKDLLKFYDRQGKLHESYAHKILCDVYEYFRKQPTLIDLKLPESVKLTIVGDIHGQFYDLMNIFKINGLPSSNNPYLFNGDIVDRGAFSVECIFTIFSYKLLYPNHIFIARGNHECRDMNILYGFAAEVKEKYSMKMFDMFTEVFNWLPLCHLINTKVLVIHGGLFSRDDVTLEELRNLQRNMQPPEHGLMVELLWSDPQIQNGRTISKRGVGVNFGPDITQEFCKLNNLDYIVRSHELKYLGYEEAHHKRCITIFSAPNYNDNMGNFGAILIIKGCDMRPAFVSFHAVPHPHVKRKLALETVASHH